jgi:hypothetical protein
LYHVLVRAHLDYHDFYTRVQGFFKLQIVHVFLDRGWNPKIKILNTFFSAF